MKNYEDLLHKINNWLKVGTRLRNRHLSDQLHSSTVFHGCESVIVLIRDILSPFEFRYEILSSINKQTHTHTHTHKHTYFTAQGQALCAYFYPQNVYI
jgi:hypothetical protein